MVTPLVYPSCMEASHLGLTWCRELNWGAKVTTDAFVFSFLSYCGSVIGCPGPQSHPGLPAASWLLWHIEIKRFKRTGAKWVDEGHTACRVLCFLQNSAQLWCEARVATAEAPWAAFLRRTLFCPAVQEGLGLKPLWTQLLRQVEWLQAMKSP